MTLNGHCFSRRAKALKFLFGREAHNISPSKLWKEMNHVNLHTLVLPETDKLEKRKCMHLCVCKGDVHVYVCMHFIVPWDQSYTCFISIYTS